ncbi:MAG: Eco29kI family restriction endonuclease [Christensenellaceae bacterium]|jgi:hypothetical protein|nr:Eco29kI family restriction endonuclease [Christensenellaceae bacterium]
MKPYNPLDKENLGASIANALIAQPICALPPEVFTGAGIYALYYTGSFLVYNKLCEANKDGQFRCPIYVGKAVPNGARKGGICLSIGPSKTLYQRLVDHSKSIISANNLDINDFYCRFLVLDDIWISLAESILLERFKPIWNVILDGFGNHNPGSGRWSGKMSPWDCMHPGRSWTINLQPCSISKCELVVSASNYLFQMLSQ